MAVTETSVQTAEFPVFTPTNNREWSSWWQQAIKVQNAQRELQDDDIPDNIARSEDITSAITALKAEENPFPQYQLSGATQVAFAGGLALDQDNCTGDGLLYTISGRTANEEYDTGNNFSTGTGEFLTPSAGLYAFNLSVACFNVQANHTDCTLYLTAGSTQYQLARVNAGNMRTTSTDFQIIGSLTLQLAAGVAVFPQILISGGARVVRVIGGGGSTSWRTRFEGFKL